MVAVEGHRRPAGAVVDQRVDVEAGDDAVLQRLQEVLPHELAGGPGVHETVEAVQQHRTRHLRQVAVKLVQILRVKQLLPHLHVSCAQH